MKLKNELISKWGVIIIVSLIVLSTALYSITTWNDPADSSKTLSDGNSSQLLDQNNQASDLQAKPSSGQILNNGSNSNQLQAPGASSNSSSNTPTSTMPASGDDYMYPVDPNPCKGINPGSDMMCLAQ